MEKVTFYFEGNEVERMVAAALRDAAQHLRDGDYKGGAQMLRTAATELEEATS